MSLRTGRPPDVRAGAARQPMDLEHCRIRMYGKEPEFAYRRAEHRHERTTSGCGHMHQPRIIRHDHVNILEGCRRLHDRHLPCQVDHTLGTDRRPDRGRDRGRRRAIFRTAKEQDDPVCLPRQPDACFGIALSGPALRQMARTGAQPERRLEPMQSELRHAGIHAEQRLVRDVKVQSLSVIHHAPRSDGLQIPVGHRNDLPVEILLELHKRRPLEHALVHHDDVAYIAKTPNEPAAKAVVNVDDEVVLLRRQPPFQRSKAFKTGSAVVREGYVQGVVRPDKLGVLGLRHEVDLSAGKAAPQRPDQGRGEHDVADRTEAYDQDPGGGVHIKKYDMPVAGAIQRPDTLHFPHTADIFRDSLSR